MAAEQAERERERERGSRKYTSPNPKKREIERRVEGKGIENNFKKEAATAASRLDPDR